MMSNKSDRLSLFAIAISLVAALAAAGSLSFSIWSYKDASSIKLLTECTMIPSSKADIIDSEFYFAIGKDRFSGQVGEHGPFTVMPTDVEKNYTTYPKVVTFYIEVKITNTSKRPVSIENIYSIISFKVWAYADDAFFKGIKNVHGTDPQFPQLINQGEQFIYFIKAGYPLYDKMIKVLEKEIDNNKSLSIGDVYTALYTSGIDLNVMDDLPKPAQLKVNIDIAGDDKIVKEVKFPFWVIGHKGSKKEK